MLRPALIPPSPPRKATQDPRNMTMDERQPLLPSYSPSVARLRREGMAASALAWPATFEEGVDARYVRVRLSIHCVKRRSG